MNGGGGGDDYDDRDTKDLESKEVIALSHSPLSSSSSVVMATTTTTSSDSNKSNQTNNNPTKKPHTIKVNTSNIDSLNTSDDIDYAATTNGHNSQSNLNDSDIQQKTNTLRFNKYGFVQHEQPNNSTGSLNRDSTSLNAVANVNNGSSTGKLNNENKSMSSLPSTK